MCGRVWNHPARNSDGMGVEDGQPTRRRCRLPAWSYPDQDRARTGTTVKVPSLRVAAFWAASLSGSVGFLLRSPLGIVVCDSSTFVWVDRLVDHPFLLRTAAAGCVGTGLLLAPPLGTEGLLGFLCDGRSPLRRAGAVLAPGCRMSPAPCGEGHPLQRDYEVVVRRGPTVDRPGLVRLSDNGMWSSLPTSGRWGVSAVMRLASRLQGRPLGAQESPHGRDGSRPGALSSVDADAGRPLAVTGSPWNGSGF